MNRASSSHGVPRSLVALDGAPDAAASPRLKRSLARRLSALGLPLGLALTLGVGCQPAAPDADAPADHEVASDVYLLRLTGGSGGMDGLRAELRRRGIAVRHSYSDLVGLGGTVSVNARADEIADLLGRLPMPVEARAAVYRYPLDTMPPCGDGSCAADEAQNAARSTTCSYDCGVPQPQVQQDELVNAWHARIVGADKVWPITRGEGVHVAVLDTGYDSGLATRHPDRPMNLGAGYDFAGGTADFAATDSHGTHVAGIIGAPRNGLGTVGIAPGATVHIYQVFRRTGGGVRATDADIVAALEAAVRNNIQIVNLSLGGGSDSELEHLALRKAFDAGILPLVAAGNGEDYNAGSVLTAPRTFPGAYPEGMSVGATSSADTIADFSATGETVTVSAPGLGVYSTVPVGGGDTYVKANFDVKGDKVYPLYAAVPEGASLSALRGELMAACGYGTAADIAACKPALKVVLVRRGPPAESGQTPLTFEEKVRNARAGGAVGVIIYNHRSGDAASAGAQFGAGIGTAVPVPVLTLPAGDGERLTYLLGQGKEVRATTSIQATDYAVFSGTSMAAPAAAGVAALVWSRYPGLTNVELRQLLVESAVDLGAPGRDDSFGWGRLDAARAIAQGTPRGRCGDGRLDRGSEVCDSDVVGTRTCEDLGWDDVAGTRLRCNSRCTGVDTGACACAPGRDRFEAVSVAMTNVTQGGKKGTLATYRVKLKGQPVRGAIAHVVVKLNGVTSFEYDLGPSDALGEISDFTPYTGTGMTPGSYEFFPVITKGAARCHDDQATSPLSYKVDIQS